jgi:hypothetical protein
VQASNSCSRTTWNQKTISGETSSLETPSRVHKTPEYNASKDLFHPLIVKIARVIRPEHATLRRTYRNNKIISSMNSLVWCQLQIANATPVFDGLLRRWLAYSLKRGYRRGGELQIAYKTTQTVAPRARRTRILIEVRNQDNETDDDSDKGASAHKPPSPP